MILDENELATEDTFEETTLRQKGHLSFIWILAGIIGFLVSILTFYLIIREPSHRSDENIFVIFLSASGIICFGLMSFWGFKSRDILNRSNKNIDIEKIARYGFIIWLLIAIYTIFIWAMFYFGIIR